MLASIHIQGFKSLRDVRLELSPLVVIFGPNAAGKSNLLEALLLLSRLVGERTLAEAFSAPLRGYPQEAFALPGDGLEGLLRKPETSLSLEAILRPTSTGTTREEDSVKYRVAVGLKPDTGALSVQDEHLVRLKRDHTNKHTPRIEKVEGPEGTDGHLLVRRKGEAGQPRREPLGLNHTIVSNLQYAGPDRYPDLDAVRAELTAWRSYYLDPRTAMREPQPPRDVNDIGAQGEWLAPFLFRLKSSQPKAFQAIQRGLRAAIPSVESLSVDLDPRRGTLDVQVVQQGIPFSSRLISEGTLRILALCAIAANPWPGALVAFEEPENGVHPRRVEVIADLLVGMVRKGNRQVVVTTHSPMLVSALLRHKRESLAPVSVVRCGRDGADTSLEPFDPGQIFADVGIRGGLVGLEDEGVVAEMLTRGWLDG